MIVTPQKKKRKRDLAPGGRGVEPRETLRELLLSKKGKVVVKNIKEESRHKED